MGKIGAEGVIDELPQERRLPPGGVDLEIAEAGEGGRDPADHGPGFHSRAAVVEHVPLDVIPGQDDAQGPGGGHPQMEHGLAAQELPDGRPQHRQPVGRAGIGRGPGPLELQGPVLRPCVDDLPQVDGPAVAQLPGPVPELVAPVIDGIGRIPGISRFPEKTRVKTSDLQASGERPRISAASREQATSLGAAVRTGLTKE